MAFITDPEKGHITVPSVDLAVLSQIFFWLRLKGYPCKQLYIQFQLIGTHVFKRADISVQVSTVQDLGANSSHISFLAVLGTFRYLVQYPRIVFISLALFAILAHRVLK